MQKNIKFPKWVILVFVISFYVVLLSTAQKKDENNPHNLTANPENCLYCHNKSSIPEEDEKFINVKLTHKFILETEDCGQCHYLGDKPQEKESGYIKSIPELCIKPCHKDGAQGLNHPVEVIPNFKVPDFLPLDNGEITCGTCHNPHGSPVIKTKSLIGWKDKKSYFLRMENSNGALCRVCHADYPVF